MNKSVNINNNHHSYTRLHVQRYLLKIQVCYYFSDCDSDADIPFFFIAG